MKQGRIRGLEREAGEWTRQSRMLTRLGWQYVVQWSTTMLWNSRDLWDLKQQVMLINIMECLLRILNNDHIVNLSSMIATVTIILSEIKIMPSPDWTETVVLVRYICWMKKKMLLLRNMVVVVVSVVKWLWLLFCKKLFFQMSKARGLYIENYLNDGSLVAWPQRQVR